MLFLISRDWKQPRCPSMSEYTEKMWFIYTVECYSAKKKMKFRGECMELETVIFGEVTQTTNTDTVSFLLQVVVSLSFQYVYFNPNAYSNCVEVC